MTDQQLYFEDVDVGDAIPALTVTVDETQMFFFSAATYNGHRIHYDKEWAARPSRATTNVLVQGPLQAALLARALTDWIGGAGGWWRSRCRTGRSPSRARSSPSAASSPASGERRRPGLVDLDIAGKRGGDVLMPGTATVALPQRGARRDRAARRGGDRRHRGAARRAQADRAAAVHARPVRAAGQDGHRGRRRRSRPAVNGLIDRTGSPSRTCSRRPPCRSTSGLPLNFGERVDLGGANVGGHGVAGGGRGRARLCDAVLAVVPGLDDVPRSARQPRAGAGLVRGVEQQLRLAAGRVRDPLRQRRARTRRTRRSPSGTRPSSATTRAAIAKIAVDQRDNACAHPGRGVPRQADHRRRRAGQPDDRRPDPHAGDRDARARAAPAC